MSVDNQYYVDIPKLKKRAADFGFRHANIDELAQGIAIAEELMGQKIAPLNEIACMDGITGCGAWVTGDPVDGIYLTFPLTKAGELAVRDGSYTPQRPKRGHLCGPGEPCSAFYCGVYAGKTHEARKNIMTATAVIRLELYAELPAFARGATEDGVRSMISLGFEPVIGGLPDLYVHEPVQQVKEAAA